MSGVQVAGPTGKAKNCNVWAQWEPKGASKTAALCHGERRLREAEKLDEVLAIMVADEAMAGSHLDHPP